jgi:iron complex transport system ATP-binding protein
MSTFLEISELTAGYGDKTVLQGLSLEVKPGELLGVIGPNGCGKSTLIKAASGVLKPKGGRVWLEGRELLKIKAEERAKIMAVVAQNPSLPAGFTAAEIVLFGRTPHLGAFQQEGPADWQIVQEAMEAADCWHMAARPVGELSGGERQRVLFALALAQQPRLLLLDEPTTYLDINYQVGVMDIAARWLRAEPGRGALAVFHDLNLAAQYCSRLVLLSAGRVLASGSPHEVISAENIRRAYGASVIIAPHPLNDLPTTFILPGSNRSN